jgi:ribose 5-phosphate isomerase A
MDKHKQALERVARDLSKKIGVGTTLGLGSGSTVAALIDELSPLVMAESKRISGVPTSAQIEMVALRNGINLVPFRGSVDLLIDGADQIDADLNLVKGGGGALLKEKVIMSSSKEVAIVASEDKFSKRLCEKGVKVPVEVVPMARESVKVKLSLLGGVPEERLLPKGYPCFTENGNMILDTMFEPVDDPRAFEVRVKAVPGVVEVGIFTIKPISVYKLMSDGAFEVLEKRE